MDDENVDFMCVTLLIACQNNNSVFEQRSSPEKAFDKDYNSAFVIYENIRTCQ